MAQTGPKRQRALRTVLIVLVGQVGCVTLIVVLLSVFGGLWLDRHFHTQPIITLALLFAGIPISVLLMLQIARRTLGGIVEKDDADSAKDNA
jgi:F0F1-type ATP synthase assembly protein I